MIYGFILIRFFHIVHTMWQAYPFVPIPSMKTICRHYIHISTHECALYSKMYLCIYGMHTNIFAPNIRRILQSSRVVCDHWNHYRSSKQYHQQPMLESADNTRAYSNTVRDSIPKIITPVNPLWPSTTSWRIHPTSKTWLDRLLCWQHSGTIPVH